MGRNKKQNKQKKNKIKQQQKFFLLKQDTSFLNYYKKLYQVVMKSKNSNRDWKIN